MAAIIKEIFRGYDFLINEFGDPRVKDWYFMDSPFPIMGLLVLYYYFIKNLGPRLMENRKPFDVKTPMIVYNIVQIIANGYFVFESIRCIWLQGEYSFTCEEVNYSKDPLPMKIAHHVWLFFLTKILDLLDTVFMVLRKKQNQVTFLHVYHHTGMVVALWIGVKYVAGGHGIFFGTVNAFVHTIMYSYYLLTAIYPEYKKSIWWKKHITELQLVQFVITSVHGLIAVINPYCNFPKMLLIFFVPQDIFMFFLFWDFYKSTYLSKKLCVNGTNGKLQNEVSRKILNHSVHVEYIEKKSK